MTAIKVYGYLRYLVVTTDERLVVAAFEYSDDAEQYAHKMNLEAEDTYDVVESPKDVDLVFSRKHETTNNGIVERE